MTDFDVIVLGSGPGGYVAAIRAAQLGKSVGVIEEKFWGGVCLNVGCIPSKALLRSAELAHLLAHEKQEFGITGDASVDFAESWKRSREVAEASATGVHYLMRKNRITEISGRGTITGPRSIEVRAEDGSVSSYRFGDLIVAVGAIVRLISGVELSPNVMTYEELILSEQLPESVVIGGSGAIGVEFAYVLKSFGTQVTIVEFADRVVPTEDAAVSAELLRQYRKLGIDVRVSTAVESVKDTGSGVEVITTDVATGDSEVLSADKFLAAFGFAPRTQGLGLEAVDVQLTDAGAIAVDSRGRTSVEGIYAVGDCTGKMMLAHTAEAMGVVAAETIAGAKTMEIDFDMIPRATFCQPQIASFGFSEEQARDRGFEVAVATFPFMANGKARGIGQTAGFVKIVANAQNNELLGGHMIGPEVTELLPALTLAQQWHLSADEVARNVFAHPTLSEAVKEAIEGIAGHMINL